MGLITALRKKALRTSIAKAKIQRKKLTKQKAQIDEISELQSRLKKVKKVKLSPAQKVELVRRKKNALARKKALVKGAKATGNALHATFKFLEKNTRGADRVAFGKPTRRRKK